MQLIVSSMMLWRECQTSPPPKITTEWRSVRLYPIPSVIYLIHNNVQFATLTYVDTSTYQIMGNLKIVTTGILFRCLLLFASSCWSTINISNWNFEYLKAFASFIRKLSIAFSYIDVDVLQLAYICISRFRLFLRRKLSNLQWMAIVLLAIGTTTSQVQLDFTYSPTFFFLRGVLTLLLKCKLQR